ncbi:hypothetical protein BH24DEI2_BH24DEI2_28640 [soil metagenome]
MLFVCVTYINFFRTKPTLKCLFSRTPSNGFYILKSLGLQSFSHLDSQVA